MKHSRRLLNFKKIVSLMAVSIIGIGVIGQEADAKSEYPQKKPITVIVPYTPGGSVDTVARIVVDKLSKGLDQTIIVENKGGASGLIGAEQVARATADGYTLLFNASSQVEMPQVMARATYDAEKDFTPVSVIGQVPLLVVTNPGIPAKDIKEFVNLVQSSKHKYTWATSGYGTSSHITEEQLKHELKLDMEIIAYKGAAPQLTDVMGGHVTAAVSPMPGVYPSVKAGKLRPIAVTSSERVPQLPDVPTVAESVLPGFERLSWYGIWGPANMPQDIVQRLATEIEKIKKDPDLTERFEQLSFVPMASTPESFAEMIHKDIEQIKSLAKAANIKIN